jgi:hypothetical protein
LAIHEIVAVGDESAMNLRSRTSYSKFIVANWERTSEKTATRQLELGEQKTEAKIAVPKMIQRVEKLLRALFCPRFRG